ncbi:MAG: D-2-hydroxyacid dehydrogenase [Lachnospiraceae bacterium]|nr:D-2-hydroxyacid dehydrogenase [Lachnospiraceae bacterium]
MKIVITDAKTIADNHEFFAPLKELGEVVIYELTKPEELVEHIGDADIVLCNKTNLHRGILEQCPNLKYIGLFATGYNNIDIECAKERGITVCNAGSYSTDAVAQHTFALILNHYNRIKEYDAFVKDGGWTRAEVFSPFIYNMYELSGKTIGIVGYGHIGEKVAEIAKAFGMNVLAYNRSAKEADGVEFVDLDTLVSSSDIVSVHCPLNAESENMFDYDRFKQFKTKGLFINTARGGIMNQLDLARALNEDIIGGAAVDALVMEPMEEGNPLLGAKNITITPHVAWAPIETRERLLDIVCDNIASYMEGTPKNVVS